MDATLPLPLQLISAIFFKRKINNLIAILQLIFVHHYLQLISPNFTVIRHRQSVDMSPKIQTLRKTRD